MASMKIFLVLFLSLTVTAVRSQQIVDRSVIKEGEKFMLTCDAGRAGVPNTFQNITRLELSRQLPSQTTYSQLALYLSGRERQNFPSGQWDVSFTGAGDGTNNRAMAITVLVSDAKCSDAGSYKCEVSYLTTTGMRKQSNTQNVRSECPQTEEPADSDDDVVAIVFVVGLGVMIVIFASVGIAVYLYRRKRNHNHSQDDHEYITVIDPGDHASDQSGNVNGDNNVIAVIGSNQSVGYYNFVMGETITVIPVTSLSTFMSTHGTEYFKKQFEKIPAVNKALPMSIGLSGANRHKNRHTDFCTYDHSRVHLTFSDDSQEDYINASYIEGYEGKEKFIACEGPTKVTSHDFIRMLWEQKPDKLIMLSNLFEEGKVVCERYWPEDGQPLRFGDVTVSLDTSQDFADYSVRQLILEREREPAHMLTQFHFKSWPDKAVPLSPWSLADFVQRVASVPTAKPIVVHDSDSVGRTGSYIALCNALREAENTGSMDFYSLLVRMRDARPHMVATLEQYIFLHQAALVSHICLGTVVKETNLTESIGKLQETSSTGETDMDMEYSMICNTCADLNNTLINSPKNATGYVPQDSNGHLNTTFVIRRRLTKEEKDSDGSCRAVLVPSFTKPDHQMLSQLPMPGIVEDFWHQVLQYRVSIIVTSAVDNRPTAQEIPDYLPPTEDNSLSCGPFHIRSGPTTSAKLWQEQGLVISSDNQQFISSRKATVKTTQHRVSHMKCRNIGTNANPSSLLKIVEQIRLRRSTNDGMTWYMCRDGASCSGLLCTLVLLLDRLDYDHYVSVPLVVGSLKYLHPQIISTKNQYRYLYEVVKVYQGTKMTSRNLSNPMVSHTSGKSDVQGRQSSGDDSSHVYNEIEEQ